MEQITHTMELLQKAAKENGPLCVGLDTDPSYIPPKLLAQFKDPAEAVLIYNREIIKHISAKKAASCFKIQIAYYEAMGLSGMKTFAETVRAVREAGFIAISDVKRGDIAATATAYARAHFTGDFETDIITINPYMGFDTIAPFTEFCKPTVSKSTENSDVQIGKSLFVLLRTSNPGAKDIEQQKIVDGDTVVSCVGEELLRLSDEFKAIYPNENCSPIGAVVGCTEESDAQMLREKYADLFFLIPGYGAQGGAARVAATLLEKAGGVVNSSRGILCAWQKDETLVEQRESNMISISDMAESAARAAIAAKKDLTDAVNAL